MVFDYTNERTFTDMMIRDFGVDRVEKVNFSAGTSGTKLQLKQDGLSILKQGYQFPNPANIRDPKKSELVRELIEQLKHEEMLLTPSSRDHLTIQLAGTMTRQFHGNCPSEDALDSR